jgi:hypothetical protein
VLHLVAQGSNFNRYHHFGSKSEGEWSLLCGGSEWSFCMIIAPPARNQPRLPSGLRVFSLELSARSCWSLRLARLPEDEWVWRNCAGYAASRTIVGKNCSRTVYCYRSQRCGGFRAGIRLTSIRSSGHSQPLSSLKPRLRPTS